MEAILEKECNSCKSNFCLGKCCCQQWHKWKWEKKILPLEWDGKSKGCSRALMSQGQHCSQGQWAPWAMEVTSHPTNPTECPTSLSCLIKQKDYLPFFSAFLSGHLFPDSFPSPDSSLSHHHLTASSYYSFQQVKGADMSLPSPRAWLLKIHAMRWINLNTSHTWSGLWWKRPLPVAVSPNKLL